MKKPGLDRVYLFAALHTIITGLSFLFGKTALRFASPIDVLAFRFTASFIALMVPVLLKKISINFKERNLLKIFVLGLLYPIAFFGFQTFGLAYATSSEAGILQSITPIFVMILSAVLLKEKSTLCQKASMLLSVLGVIYIFIMKGSSVDFTEVLGITLLLLSSLSSAGYTVLNRITLRDFSIIEISFMMTLLGFLVFNATALATHFWQGTLNQFFAPLQSFEFIISILYLGILSSLVTSLLNSFVLSKIEAAKMSVFGNLRTVVAIFAGVFFLKEQLYYYHIIGSLMIIAGVIGTNYTMNTSN
ncbi:MAG TPA: DMT family transporter [Thermoanaerobacterales bacterium]|nr:DMT family transporter [Thermoanaerobacterales bacterium]